MDALREAGLEQPALDAATSGRPFLGICVGMQMLFDGSEEDDSAIGLGIIPGTIRWLGSELPRPQMQWNLLSLSMPDDPMFAGLSAADAWVYFVHSLHGVPDDDSVIAATCTYGGVVNAAFRQDNVFATQFHPEKSGTWGVSMLGNFVRIAAEATVGR
jgi:glutamine amidotransferase